MSNRKYVILAFLVFCLTATLFIGITSSRSQIEEDITQFPWTKTVENKDAVVAAIQPYDPWMDINDDGAINIVDVVALGLRFDTNGTPINKTALLLDLQERVEALESNYSITDLKLASGAIPHIVKHSTTLPTTSSADGFVDMPGMSVDLTLTRNSTLLIIFSAEAWLSGIGTYALYVRAMVNTTQANPVSNYVTLTTSADYGSYSYTFYSSNVVAGTYTIKIQWRVYDISTVGHVNERTLTVMALPS